MSRLRSRRSVEAMFCTLQSTPVNLQGVSVLSWWAFHEEDQLHNGWCQCVPGAMCIPLSQAESRQNLLWFPWAWNSCHCCPPPGSTRAAYPSQSVLTLSLNVGVLAQLSQRWRVLAPPPLGLIVLWLIEISLLINSEVDIHWGMSSDFMLRQ